MATSARNVEIEQAVARLRLVHPELNYFAAVTVRIAMEQSRPLRALAEHDQRPEPFGAGVLYPSILC